jgi:hypothetical protein
MSMLAVNKILKDTGHPSPHQGTWGAHHEYFKTVFSMVGALPIRMIATAHIQRDTNDLSGVTEWLPLLAGKMAGLIPIFFDEVYYTSAAVDASGKQNFTFKTKRTPQMTQAKSRWNVPDGTETTFSVVEKFLNAPPAK